jgi:hypothetical protein
MKTLFLVVAYSHTHNLFAKYLVTADTKLVAESLALTALDNTFQCKRTETICTTPDYVFEEV